LHGASAATATSASPPVAGGPATEEGANAPGEVARAAAATVTEEGASVSKEAGTKSATDLSPPIAKLPVPGATEESSDGEHFDNLVVDRADLGAASRARVAIAEQRMQHLLKDNAALCDELRNVTRELENARAVEEELRVTWRAAVNMSARQKVVAQNLGKTAQMAHRSELQRLTEMARQNVELKSVHAQLQSVYRQLDFATELQQQSLTESENKIASRTKKIRKLELAIYAVVMEAQMDKRLQAVTKELVGKCGPLVQNVLVREAHRQALDFATQEV